MTKVDERADVPRLDAGLRAALAAALDRPDVVAASLVGSQAREAAGPLSDVDIAVWLAPTSSREERAALRLTLADLAAAALGTGEVDLVVLNDAPPLLEHRAMRDGVRLLERDVDERVRLETAALLVYLDTEPLRRTLIEAMRRRLAEDRFGRR